MNKWLPSKRIVLFGVLVIFILSVFLIFKYKDNYNKPDLNNMDSSLLSLNKNTNTRDDIESDIDSDKDGLKDWEEDLWKTDINNPDTDGDGTTDGDEVKQDRDPLIPGPDDSLGLNNYTKNTTSSGGVTVTDAILGQVFGDYLTLKENNNYNKESKKDLVENTIDSINSYNQAIINEYTLDDLNIDSNLGDKQSLENYSSKLREIFINGPDIQNNVILLYQILNQKGDFNQIEESIGFYRVAEKELLATKVPFELSSKHLKLINTIESMVYSSKEMLLFNEDPITAMVGVKDYSLDVETMRNLLNDINNYLAAKSITNIF